MSLVTIQRSPTPSDDVEKQDVVDADDLRQSEPSANKSSSASEDFLAVKGAAMALPQGSRRRESLPGNQGSFTTLEVHLRKIYDTLRSSDTLKLAVTLEKVSSTPADHHRYLCLVSCTGRQGTEECILLGVDITVEKASFGLVLPVFQDMRIQPDGDGGFKVFNKDLDHLFKPVSVQALWSAIQSIDQVLVVARNNNYFSNGLNHDWVPYYKSRINSSRQHINEWHRTDDSEEQPRSASPQEGEEADERARVHNEIRSKLREIMVSVDLDEVTVMDLRKRLAEKLDFDLRPYKKFIGESVLFILGQLDSPTKIFDYLYLGSKWNACNLEELQKNGVQYILNITREIDNFFIDVMKEYKNIRELDVETTNLLPYWDETHRFINKARDDNSRVLVHCKMGVSRSASTVMAYVMKEHGWSLERAKTFVTDKRSCVYPNRGFMRQLNIYEGMLSARQNSSKFSEEPKPAVQSPPPCGPRLFKTAADLPDEPVDPQPINVEQDIFQFKKAPPVLSLDDTSNNIPSKSSTRSSAPSNRSIATDPMEEAGPRSPMGSVRGGKPADTRMADLRFVRDELIEARNPQEIPWRRSLRRKTEEMPAELNRCNTAPQVVTDPEATSPSQSAANRRLRPDNSWIQSMEVTNSSEEVEMDWSASGMENPKFFLGGDVAGEETSTDAPAPRVTSWPLTDLPDNTDELNSSQPRCGIVQQHSSRLMLLATGQGEVEVDGSEPSAPGGGEYEIRRSRSCSLYRSESIPLEPGIVAKTRESIEARERTTSDSAGDQRASITCPPPRVSPPVSTPRHQTEPLAPARYFSAISLPCFQPAAPPEVPIIRLSDADELGGESSSDPQLAELAVSRPVVTARTLLLIRQVGNVISRERESQSADQRNGHRVRQIVQQVEDLVDREPIRPVRQLVEHFREVAVDAPWPPPASEVDGSPRLRPMKTIPVSSKRRASECDIPRRRRMAVDGKEKEKAPWLRRSAESGRVGESHNRSVHRVMRHSNPIFNTM